MSYRIGRGEQGVLTFEPYKSALLPLWRFKTAEIARQSSKQIYQKFEEYDAQNDFVGMDMCRKFLQMVSPLQKKAVRVECLPLVAWVDGVKGHDESEAVCELCGWEEV